MRSALLAISVLVVSVASAQTPSNKQEQVPTAILLNSRYVYVEAWDGDFFNPHLLPEDRKAISDVQNALQDWNRYLITLKRREAEILVVVHKGRIASVNASVGGNIGSGPGEGGPAMNWARTNLKQREATRWVLVLRWRDGTTSSSSTSSTRIGR